MKIGFVVNDVLPGMGMPCSGQGLRAWGLISGLRARGVDAYAIIRHSMVSSRIKRWKDFGILNVPDYVIVTNNDTLKETISNFDYILFHNWAAGYDFVKPEGSNVKFVYDFFSATLIEHSFISTQTNYLDDIRHKKFALVDQADGFIANGPGRVSYAQQLLAERGIDKPVHDLPTCLPWLGEEDKRNLVLVGGYEQAWAKSPSIEIIEYLARRDSQTYFCKVGGNQHYHFGREARPQTTALDNILLYDVVNFEDYARLNARSRAFLDIAPLNEERRISLSTRGILSIACGCPLVHNAETDLGRWVSEYDAGVTVSEGEDLTDFEVLANAITQSATPEKSEGCRALWQDHFDAAKSAVRLMEILHNV